MFNAAWFDKLFANTVLNSFQNIWIILEFYRLLPIYIGRICILWRLEIFKVNKKKLLYGITNMQQTKHIMKMFKKGNNLRSSPEWWGLFIPYVNHVNHNYFRNISEQNVPLFFLLFFWECQNIWLLFIAMSKL